LEEAGIGSLVDWLIWPSTEVSPEELGTDIGNKGNLIDSIVKLIEDPPN